MSMSSAPPPTLPKGISKSILTPGTGRPGQLGDIATVEYRCTVVSDGTVFARSASPQKITMGDSGMIDGWDLTVRTMLPGERALIRLEDPAYGYGATGVPPVVPPGAALELDVKIDSIEMGTDLGTIASSDPLKPRTPASIAAAYATRRELAALEAGDEKGGIEGMIEKVKGFYFFGFFEGETGQEAPWYLQPSITFPIAFAVVGAAFYVLYAAGGISERGEQIKDELDDIIVASAAIPTYVTALLS